MKIEGTVRLKKVTPAGAVYAMSVEGAQTENLVVPVPQGKAVGKVGTITIDIPDEEEPATKRRGRK